MRGFRKHPDGTLSSRFSREEKTLLATLATQVTDMLDDRGTRTADDPAVRRLLPDAYRDDAEAAAEFRKFTEDDLAGGKISNARVLVASLETSSDTPTSEVRLDSEAVQAWLRCLTDIRLTVASRLGIEKDDDEGADDREGLVMREVYHWLGFVQESLLAALDY